MISFVDHLIYLLLRYIVEDEQYAIEKDSPTVRECITVNTVLTGFVEQLEDVLEEAENREAEPYKPAIITKEKAERALYDELSEGTYLEEYAPMELKEKMSQAFSELEAARKERVMALIKNAIYENSLRV